MLLDVIASLLRRNGRKYAFLVSPLPHGISRIWSHEELDPVASSKRGIYIRDAWRFPQVRFQTLLREQVGSLGTHAAPQHAEDVDLEHVARLSL